MLHLRRTMSINKHAPGVSNPSQGRHAAGDGGVARGLAFPILVAAQSGDHHGGFPGGWRARRFVILHAVSHQSPPFVLLQKDGAWQIGSVDADLGHIINAPSHHHVQGQTDGQAIGGAELALFDIAATAFQGAMENLYAPPFGIPGDPLTGILESGGGHGGQQQPFQGVGSFGRIFSLASTARIGMGGSFRLLAGGARVT